MKDVPNHIIERAVRRYEAFMSGEVEAVTGEELRRRIHERRIKDANDDDRTT